MNNDRPDWMTDQAYSMLTKGYLLEGEEPRQLYLRLADAYEKNALTSLFKSSYNKEKEQEVEEIKKRKTRLFDYMWNNWFCPSTPIMSNFGTDRGLGISCFSFEVGDSMDQIGKSAHELMMLSKYGGGVGSNFNNVRPRDSLIQGGKNGKSEGTIPFIKIMDSCTVGSNQGSTRRGAFSANMFADHGDIDEFIKIRRPQGDVNRQCLNIHHGIFFTREFIERAEKGFKKERGIWTETIRTRLETGEPYMSFYDNINDRRPQWYVDKGHFVNNGNICQEIELFSDMENTFVCCVSSTNIARFNEWKDNSLFIEDCIFFLDAVMEDFIIRSANIPGFERSNRFAKYSRALGLGVLGWHTFLQTNELVFDTSWNTMRTQAEIFGKIQRESISASEKMAKIYGEPELMIGYGRRHSHLNAIAPTFSNSRISGGLSAGIEPIAANCYADKTAKGTFVVKNPTLEKLLISINKNTDEVWKSITINEGSVQHLDFLDQHQKDVYLTAREINQFHIITQAAQRQNFIDQGQSVNLFFPANANLKYVNKVHLEASKVLNRLYYCRSTSVLKGDVASRYYDENSCKSCEG